MIANRVENYEEGKNLYNKLSVVVNKFLNINLEFLGIIPLDENISRSVMQQNPVTTSYPNSSGAKAFENLADVLLSNEKKSEKDEKIGGVAGIFAKIFRNSGKK
jgi:flagellar biosynthesis protein FlhG